MFSQDFDEFCLFEGMSSISALIRAAESESSTRKIISVLYDADKSSKKYSQIKFLSTKAAELGFELAAKPTEYIDSIASGKTHGGFIAVCEKRRYPSLLDGDIKPNGIYYIIDGVEDPFNYGYTVRALYAAGADGIILPPRNWTDATAVVGRSSAGTSELIKTYVDEPESAVRYLRSKGYRIACANIKDSESLYSADLSAPIAFIIGGEKRGISSTLLELADLNVRIDYAADFKGSLPTASAAALFAFEAARKNGKFNC